MSVPNCEPSGREMQIADNRLGIGLSFTNSARHGTILSSWLCLGSHSVHARHGHIAGVLLVSFSNRSHHQRKPLLFELRHHHSVSRLLMIHFYATFCRRDSSGALNKQLKNRTLTHQQHGRDRIVDPGNLPERRAGCSILFRAGNYELLIRSVRSRKYLWRFWQCWPRTTPGNWFLKEPRTH